MSRVIMHVDLDSFYASAEELRNPDIKGKAIVICVYSGRSGDSGAVSTANYKAREMGIKAGIPIRRAKQLAGDDDVVFLPNDIEYYREVSERIMEILEGNADMMQQVSVDEAYLDVTEKCRGSFEQAEITAAKIKKDVLEKEGLTCSVGIGPNKLIAKMASKEEKPDGLTVVRDNDVPGFLEGKPVDDLHGIGPKTRDILEELSVSTVRDLAGADQAELSAYLGENKAVSLIEKAKGIDDSPVEPQLPKQLSRIGTLKEDTKDFEEIYGKIEELTEDLGERIRKKNVCFRTVSIITIDTKLDMQTKSETVPVTCETDTVSGTAKRLLEAFLQENPGRKLRRVGVRVSNLAYMKGQGSLSSFWKS